MLDANDHAFAVDVADLQPRDLRGPQSRGIGGGQGDTDFEAWNRSEKARDFILIQHDRQLLRQARVGDAFGDLRLSERDLVEEAQCANGLVERRPGGPF